MKISEMTYIFQRVPFPLRAAIDKLGEKDPEIKKYVVGIDYAVSSGMNDATVKILMNEFLAYLEEKYFTRRLAEGTKVVFFIADKRKR
jgi:hypothetical protein